CWDAPKPLGMVASALSDSSGLWLAIPGQVVHVAAGTATVTPTAFGFADQPQLVGGDAAGIWATSGAKVQPLDRSTRTTVGGQLAPHTPGDAWGVIGGVLEHYDGNAWSAQSVPSALAGATFSALAATSSGELWVFATAIGHSYVAHLTSGAWTWIDAPTQAT